MDVDNLIVSQPDYGEQALEITAALVTSGGIDVIVIDSVAALVPKAELDGEMGDSHMGLHARLMSQALRKLTGTVARTNTLLIFINQIREKIGVMFGNPETTTGGRALKFYSSVRVEVRRMTAIKDGDKIIGNRTKIKVVKNKVAAPFREAEVDILYGEGISRESDLLDLGVIHELVEKSGSWFSLYRRADRAGPRERARFSGRESGGSRAAGYSSAKLFGVQAQRGCPKPPVRPALAEPGCPKRLNSGSRSLRKPSKARFIGFRGVALQKN